MLQAKVSLQETETKYDVLTVDDTSLVNTVMAKHLRPLRHMLGRTFLPNYKTIILIPK